MSADTASLASHSSHKSRIVRGLSRLGRRHRRSGSGDSSVSQIDSGAAASGPQQNNKTGIGRIRSRSSIRRQSPQPPAVRRSSESAQAKTNSANAAPAKERDSRLPFLFPAKTCEIPKPRKLSDVQETKYSQVLEFCKNLKEIPDGLKTRSKSGIREDEQMWMTRECILRYLRATKWDVAQAKHRIEHTLAWRREYRISKLDEKALRQENATGKQTLTGFDKNGRPCLYLHPARQNTKPSPRQVQNLVFGLERTIDLMPPGVEMLALLINFKSSSGGSIPSVSQGKEVLYILQTHYVERLGKALVINVPWFVWGFFKLITPFIDPATREKLKFNEHMPDYVPTEQLDTEFGGSAPLHYHPDLTWDAVVEECAKRRRAMKERWETLEESKVGASEYVLRGGTDFFSAGEHATSNDGPKSEQRKSTSNEADSAQPLLQVPKQSGPPVVANTADAELSRQKSLSTISDASFITADEL